ncbi:uncharacterized protein LOC144826944 [Lissotriton helveticus]
MVQVTVPSPPYNKTVLLAKNSTTEVVLPSDYILIEGERSRKLVTVSSDADISVIAFNTGVYSADAFACLSKQDLGTEYFVFTSVSWHGNYFAVGNGEDVETQVNITVSGSLLVDGTRYEDKQMVTITLAPKEVILLSDANDLTGTRVASSTPVAVFSGSKCYNSPYSYCDIVIKQLYPVQRWGQQFVVFPLMIKEVRDRIIFIAARPNTTVTLRNESTTLQYSLQPGSHVSMDLQTGMLVDATEPIMVGYLFQGGTSSLPFIFDPFIATVLPSNFPWRYYKFVTKDFFYNYLFIVSRSSSSSSDFLLDYRPLSDYVPTVRHLEDFTGWEVNLGKIGGQHEISHQSETFGIYVYGVEYCISYGYSLGQAESFSGVLQCDPVCADNELCTNSAGYTECKCQRSKYLNASRNDIVPTVQCEASAMTVSLNKCLLERFNYSFTQMHFEDTNCTAITSLQLEGNERVIQVKAIPRAGWCGNEMVIYDKTVTYSNILYIPPDDTSGIIISSSLRFNFSCTYNRTMQTSLLTALHPTMDNITGPSEDGSGSITATMAAFKSNSFNDPVLENDTLKVGTPVYIGISTTFPDGDTFTLRAERCVAAPSINLGDPSIELISGGCAMTQTMNVQVVENGQSLQVMFEIEAFIFNGQPDVYMWCDVSLCLKDPSTTCQCSSSSDSASTGP